MTLAVAHSLVSAAEVRNLHVGQEKKRVFLQYDLTGKPGEKLADVTVSLIIGGDRYHVDRLSLSGDFGKNIKIGIGKRIYWDLLRDMPAGYEGEIGWDVEAASTAEFIAAARIQQDEAAKEAREQAIQDRGTGANGASSVSQSAAVSPGGLLKTTKEYVLDERTGRMWAKLGSEAGTKMSFGRAQSLLKKMNDRKYAGFQDWRMATVKDYTSLHKLASSVAAQSRSTPFKVLEAIFPGLVNWNYWILGNSSSMIMTNVLTNGFTWNGALTFDLENGTIGESNKLDELCVLPVREVASED